MRDGKREREISKHAKRTLLPRSPPPALSLSLCAVLQSAESVSCLTLPSLRLISALNVKSPTASAWHYPALSSLKETANHFSHCLIDARPGLKNHRFVGFKLVPYMSPHCLMVPGGFIWDSSSLDAGILVFCLRLKKQLCG